MDTRIWKFPIAFGSDIPKLDISMPKGARIIHAGPDPSGRPCVWVECIPRIPSEETEKRFFTVIGTGWEVPDKGKHVASYVDGSFVWHIYEILSD